MTLPAKYRALAKQLEADELTAAPDHLAAHAGDKWFARALPELVALPRSTKSVSTILRFANQRRIPVTPRGAGHGYVGGCVPSQGGNTRGAIEKIGSSCPIGFYSSGEYCVSSPNNQREAIQKSGNSCPIGWFSSGSDCLKNR